MAAAAPPPATHFPPPFLPELFSPPFVQSLLPPPFHTLLPVMLPHSFLFSYPFSPPAAPLYLRRGHLLHVNSLSDDKRLSNDSPVRDCKTTHSSLNHQPLNPQTSDQDVMPRVITTLKGGIIKTKQLPRRKNTHLLFHKCDFCFFFFFFTF